MSKWIKVKDMTSEQYLRYKNRYIRQRKKSMGRCSARRLEAKKWFEEYKSTLSCTVCGENHIACLDFHHINKTEKEKSISQAVSHGWPKDKILEEINKCKVLCSNCHRKLHWEERNNQVSNPLPTFYKKS